MITSWWFALMTIINSLSISRSLMWERKVTEPQRKNHTVSVDLKQVIKPTFQESPCIFCGHINLLLGLVSAILIMLTATTDLVISLPSYASWRHNHISSELYSSRADRNTWPCQPMSHTNTQMGMQTDTHTHTRWHIIEFLTQTTTTTKNRTDVTKLASRYKV